MFLAWYCLPAETIPFSHRLHAPLKVECAYCHGGVKTAERAGFPAAKQCMTCHRAVAAANPVIQRLASLAPEAKLVPSKRIYRVPDFVFFSHAVHGKAGAACATCHGEISTKDTVEKEVTLNMKFCVDCHKGRSATIVCNACHELNQ